MLQRRSAVFTGWSASGSSSSSPLPLHAPLPYDEPPAADATTAAAAAADCDAMAVGRVPLAVCWRPLLRLFGRLYGRSRHAPVVLGLTLCWAVTLVLGEWLVFRLMLRPCAFPRPADPPSWWAAAWSSGGVGGDDGADGGQQQQAPWGTVGPGEWPAGTQRLLIVADPQLQDSGSYGYAPAGSRVLRLIEFQCDLYMRKAFQRIIRYHSPDAVVFLGDLFDHGRHIAPDEYAHSYARFQWVFGTGSRPVALYNVSGNHDIGYRLPQLPDAARRFELHFGPLNYKVRLASGWTLVTVSSLTLDEGQQQEAPDSSDGSHHNNNNNNRRSAAAAPAPATQSAADAPAATAATAAAAAAAAVGSDAAAAAAGGDVSSSGPPAAGGLGQQTRAFVDSLDPVGDYPSVLLSHVPLWRPPQTPCGPLGRGPLEDRRGYSYRNLLRPRDSQRLLERLEPRLVLSGDDHSHCLRDHPHPTQPGMTIPEHTVSTFSWMQGVTYPGFALVTLPPVPEPRCAAAPCPPAEALVRICFLPAQLSTYHWYLALFVAMLLWLAVLNRAPPGPGETAPAGSRRLQRLTKFAAAMAMDVGLVFMLNVPLYLALVVIETI